ncbi:MAG: glycosyltransferase family 4 protein [Dehalococcoidales bacterium]|nr:glycosyltransferase family 4 protein [Dehalococcoidales bacterium]
MRIVLASPYPVEKGQIPNGPEKVAKCLLDEFRKIGGLDLHVVTFSPSINQDSIVREEDLTIYRLPCATRLVALTFSSRDTLRLRKKIREIKPDVVHAQTTTAYTSGALASGYPAVITVHGIFSKDISVSSGVRRFLKSKLLALFESACIRSASDIIAISPYILKEFGGLIRGSVHNLENPVHERYYRIRNCEKPGRVLYAGRVIRRKGVLDLVRAIEKVRWQVPGVELRIAGETDSEPDCVAEINEFVGINGLDGNVRFLGNLDEARFQHELGSASILALTSMQETAPAVIQQAMAVGKPVVATRVCGNPYLVEHGGTGLLVDYGDVLGIAEAVADLLADSKKRKEMAARAKHLAQRFRADVIARKTLEIYEKIGKSRRFALSASTEFEGTN